MTPSCCNMPSLSDLVQSSITLPSANRVMTIPVIFTFFAGRWDTYKLTFVCAGSRPTVCNHISFGDYVLINTVDIGESCTPHRDGSFDALFKA